MKPLSLAAKHKRKCYKSHSSFRRKFVARSPALSGRNPAIFLTQIIEFLLWTGMPVVIQTFLIQAQATRWNNSVCACLEHFPSELKEGGCWHEIRVLPESAFFAYRSSLRHLLLQYAFKIPILKLKSFRKQFPRHHPRARQQGFVSHLPEHHPQSQGRCAHESWSAERTSERLRKIAVSNGFRSYCIIYRRGTFLV